MKNSEYEFMPRPSVGRIVRYVMEHGEVRPALIVRVWDRDYMNEVHPGMSNLVVFLDGENDRRRGSHHDVPVPDTRWVGSVGYGADCQHGTWHWPASEPNRG